MGNKDDSHILEINTPELLIPVNNLGTNSLLGALVLKLQELNLLDKLYAYNPDSIKFLLLEGSNVNQNIDLYFELNLVKNFLKIDANKIKFHVNTKNLS
jgi:hypothetical protein